MYNEQVERPQNGSVRYRIQSRDVIVRYGEVFLYSPGGYFTSTQVVFFLPNKSISTYSGNNLLMVCHAYITFTLQNVVSNTARKTNDVRK